MTDSGGAAGHGTDGPYNGDNRVLDLLPGHCRGAAASPACPANSHISFLLH